MLNKIENINLKPDMRSEVKSSKKDSGVNKVYKKESFADTLTYSSALIYISHLNWKLKKFNVSSDEQIEVEFQFENYSFRFLVNPKFPTSKNINIKIEDSNTIGYHKVSKFVLELSFNYRIINNDFINYEILNTVFSKIKNFYIPSESEVNSTYYFNIINGVEEKLSVLLSQIYSNVILFIEKLNNKKFLLGSEDISDYISNSIIIRGINVEY
jgi:hypothetical protein